MHVLYAVDLKVGKGVVPCRIYRQGDVYGICLWDRAKAQPLGKHGRQLAHRVALEIAKAMESAKSDAMRAAILWAALGYDALRYRNGLALASTITHPGLSPKVAGRNPGRKPRVVAEYVPNF